MGVSGPVEEAALPVRCQASALVIPTRRRRGRRLECFTGVGCRGGGEALRPARSPSLSLSVSLDYSAHGESAICH